MNPCPSSASHRGNRSSSPRSPLCSVLFRWTQPQRDMHWLHGFLDNRYELLAQLVEIDLIAQCRAESCQRLGSVILTTVEAAVDAGLETMAQGLEESSNYQCRDNDDDGRLRELSYEQAYQ